MKLVGPETNARLSRVARGRKRGGIDFNKLEATRKRLEISGNREGWPQEFDDPKFSRQVLGLEEDD